MASENNMLTLTNQWLSLWIQGFNNIKYYYYWRDFIKKKPIESIQFYFDFKIQVFVYISMSSPRLFDGKVPSLFIPSD